MLFLTLAIPSYCSVASSASIINAAPVIRSVTTYSNYTSCTNNTPSTAFGPNETVFIQVNVSDANEHFDITDNGYIKIKIVLFNGSAESDFTRFGTNYSLTATLESGYDVYATYTAQFNMSSSDATRLGAQPYAGYYRIKVSVSDGTNVTTSNISASQNADYTYSNSTTAVTTAGFDGSTTDMSVVDIHNVTNLVVEKATYGKINFTSVVNFTQSVNLSSYVNVSSNYIFVNSTALPEFNRSAMLYLYNLTFTDPTPEYDPEDDGTFIDCPESVCTEVSYSSGNYVFTVTHFTSYRSAEGYQAPEQHRSSGSSGGWCNTNWTCTAWSACVGGTQTRSCLKAIPYCSAEAQPEVSRTCSVEEIASNATEQPAATVAAALFDIDLKMTKGEIFSSEMLSAVVSLTNIGKAGRVSADLHYTITDASGTIVYQEDETVSVETQMQFVKQVDVSQLLEGRYKLAADLSYEGQKEPASAEDFFVVKAGKFPATGQVTFFADIKEVAVVSVFAIIVVAYFISAKIKRRSKLEMSR